jgi:20S proteasome alpha/beta subunit
MLARYQRRWIYPPRHKRQRPRREVRRMTVCVAALAGEGNAIICVADKALSYGGTIEWDADTTKIFPLNDRSVALASGSEKYIMRVLRKIVDESVMERSRSEIISGVESCFAQAYAEMQDIDVLRKAGITRNEYVRGVSKTRINAFFSAIASEMIEYDFDGDMLICGYDENKKPLILLVAPPGVVTDYTEVGFHAVGTGSEKAVSALLFSEHLRGHGLGRALYDCFDAKARAEMAPGVGFAWDSRIVFNLVIADVHEGALRLVERLWTQHNRSPFEERKEGDLPDPPKNWVSQLNEFILASLPTTVTWENNEPDPAIINRVLEELRRDQANERIIATAPEFRDGDDSV